MKNSRSRYRVGRAVQYQPTDAEAATGNDTADAQWPARITKVNADGTVNLFVHEADGTTVAKTSIARGGGKGQFTFIGPAAGT